MLFEVAITKKDCGKEEMVKDTHSIIANSTQKAAMMAFQGLEADEDIDDLVFYIRPFITGDFKDDNKQPTVIGSLFYGGNDSMQQAIITSSSPSLHVNNPVYTSEIMSGTAVMNC